MRHHYKANSPELSVLYVSNYKYHSINYPQAVDLETFLSPHEEQFQAEMTLSPSRSGWGHWPGKRNGSQIGGESKCAGGSRYGCHMGPFVHQRA